MRDREQHLETLEHELVEQALKLPNKTHFDTPVGDETMNLEVKKGGPDIDHDRTFSHLEIA